MQQPLSSLTLARPRRGAAALAVSIVLLFVMTLIGFFVNRGMIFEQRTSANQYRATKAFEMAEAGLEWAVAQLNSEAPVTAAPSCAATTGAATNTFAARYLTIGPGGLGIVANGRASGSIAANGSVTSSCPLAGNAATLGGADEPRFMVEFSKVGVTDPWAVRIIARGCTNAGNYCVDGTTTGPQPDGVAVVSAIYKMLPALPLAPGAGLVTGGSATTGGNFRVVNDKDYPSNGITINSGSVVNLGSGTEVQTIGGTHPRASILDNDPSLRNLTNADGSGETMFQSFMGDSFTQFQASPKTWIITSGACAAAVASRCTSCGGAVACGTALMDVYTNKGVEKFWADTPVQFGMSNRPAVSAENPDRSFGTSARPLIIGSSANVDFNGAIVAYGMFYAATATATDNYVVVGTGSATVVGAIVTRSDFVKGAGTMNLIYDAKLFTPQQNFGLMVRVPGSWRDTLTDL
jgi:PilX N-terminal